jgi:hypothetical protein
MGYNDVQTVNYWVNYGFGVIILHSVSDVSLRGYSPKRLPNKLYKAWNRFFKPWSNFASWGVHLYSRLPFRIEEQFLFALQIFEVYWFGIQF